MRGVYEYPAGSEVWYIHYFAAGKRHREKVGASRTRSNFIRSEKRTLLLVGSFPSFAIAVRLP